ncbi:unnamed protein product, partial [marine sediment metagenome]
DGVHYGFSGKIACKRNNGMPRRAIALLLPDF